MAESADRSHGRARAGVRQAGSGERGAARAPLRAGTPAPARDGGAVPGELAHADDDHERTFCLNFSGVVTGKAKIRIFPRDRMRKEGDRSTGETVAVRTLAKIAP